MPDQTFTPRPAADRAVQLFEPDEFDGRNPTIPGLTLDVDGDRCQAADCCVIDRAKLGWATDSWEDRYGVDHEDIKWESPWRLPDGRLVCEDCAVAWDEGEPV